MYAAEKGNIVQVTELLSHHAKVDLQDKNGKTALFYAVSSVNGENDDVVSKLIEKKCDVNLATTNNVSPLH